MCAFCARVRAAARVRDRRDGSSFFSLSPPPLLLRLREGGIHFAAQRPRLPRTAPFDCFDYPYFIPPRLIPSAHILQTHSGRSFSSFALARESRFAILPFPVTPRNVRARHDKSGSATRRGNPVSRDAGVFKTQIDSASTFWGEKKGEERQVGAHSNFTGDKKDTIHITIDPCVIKIPRLTQLRYIRSEYHVKLTRNLKFDAK